MKPNWTLINESRIGSGPFGSRKEDGFNGAFRFRINGVSVRCIASDGLGWQHVSVSLFYSDMTPSWSIMCQVKEIFWGDDEWVMEFHPPRDQYINNHPGCLHLWRPTDQNFPVPEQKLVGVAGKENLTYDQAIEEFRKAHANAKLDQGTTP